MPWYVFDCNSNELGNDVVDRVIISLKQRFLVMANSWSSSRNHDQRVRKLWIEMCKIFLGAMVILKVHDVYGKREVRPALW